MARRLTLGVLAVLVAAGLAVPAGATDPTITFAPYSYSAAVTRIAPGGSVTFSPSAGDSFVATDGVYGHPLTFVGHPELDVTSGTAAASVPFATPGVYRFYCANHGSYDPVTGQVSGMSGEIIVTANQPPTASFTATPSTVNAGQTVSFDASASTDDHGISAYRWNFGDGTTASTTTPTTTHAFSSSSTVTLTVVDDNADAVGPESASATQRVTVNAPATSPTTTQPGAPVAPGTPATPGTSPTPVDHAPPHVVLVTRTLRLSTLRSGHAKLTFTSSEAGGASATLKAGSTTVATASVSYKAGGRHSLTLKLTAKGRTKLRHATHVALRLSLVVHDVAGNHAGTSLSLARVH